MLSKIIGSLVVVGLLAVSPTVSAHSTNVGVTVNSGPIVVSWTRIAGCWNRGGWVRAHWFHPSHGKFFRAERHGPPPVHAHTPPPRHKHQPRHYRPHQRR